MSLATNLTSPRRLEALAETCLVNSPPEDSFDRYTRLCSALLEVPVSLVGLVESDRLYLKSRYARLSTPELPAVAPISISFCQFVVTDSEPFVVEDCRNDPRTRGSVAVTDYHIRAYAGLPIRTPEGEIVGSFCAMDFQPRSWSEADLEHLADLRNGIESEIALRLQVFRLDKTGADLRRHLRAAQQLFSNLGHEVRTPLNAMVNLSQACSELNELPSAAETLVTTVLDSAQRLAGLLEGTLDLAALEAGQVSSEASVVDLHSLLATNQAIIVAMERPELTLNLDLSAELPSHLRLDGRRLAQLLAILLQYHLGRSQWQGALTLKAEVKEKGRLDLRLSCRGYSLTAEEVAALFTSNPLGVQSSGLSPSIIAALTELLGARLWATSLGDEVQFHLRLPALAAAPPQAAAPFPEDRALRILAVDDDSTNLTVLTFLTAKMGHELVTSRSGAQALELLSEEAYEVLLLDLRMPEMDGFEVARRVRALGLSMPIVAITADASSSARQQAKESGIDAFLTKPIKRAELSSLLESLTLEL